ncbi:MAG TPA: peptide ABC transporter substrate-binding protein [Candidatus Acidoferrales bacterium]|nr:peptide ABC transporter substrate-binding protein [Candidatus Acidoferrales bacterium]
MSAILQKFFPALCFGGLFLFCTVACKAAPQAGGEKAFRVNIGTEPPTLDWSLATDHVSFNVIANLMVGLAEFDRDLKPSPVIAKSWEIHDGGRKIVFRLRDDVLWSDGQKVRAADFAYSWKRLLNPRTASEYAYILFDIVNAEAYNRGKLADESAVGVVARDEFTLEVRLRSPVSYFVPLTTFEVTYPQRRDIVEKYGPEWTQPAHIVTNGPFLLTSWKHDHKIELAPNPRFFLGRPALEKVEMFMIREKTTALSMYEQGRLDFIDNKSIPALEKPRAAKMAGHQLVPQLRGYYYGFVVDRKPFDDVRVRRAFSMALDKNVFGKILHGGERAASCWIPPGMLAHNPKIGLSFNPPEARRLLREAGYPDGRGFPPIALGFNGDEEDHRIVAEAAQGMWKKNLGVLVRLESQEWKVYLKKLQTDPPHLFRLGWGADYPDPDNFMKVFASFSGNNHTRWKNPRYDRLLDAAATEPNPERRARLYDEAQKVLCEQDLPIVPLFTTTETTVLSPRYTGLQYSAMSRLLLQRVRPKHSPPAAGRRP